MGLYLKKAMDAAGTRNFPTLNIRFNPDSDLGIMEKRIVDQVFVHGVSELEKAESGTEVIADDACRLISKAIKDLPDVQQDLESIIMNFSTILTRSFETLKGSISPEIEALYDEIVSETDAKMKVVQDETGARIDLDMMELSLIDIQSAIAKVDDISNIREAVHTYLGIEATAISKGYLTRLWESFSTFSWQNTEVEKFFKTTFVEQVCSELGDLSPEEIEEVYAILLSVGQERYSRYSKLSSDTIHGVVLHIYKLVPILTAVHNATMAVPEQYTTIFNMYLERIRILLNACAYTLFCIENYTLLGKSLVYSYNLVNAAKFREFEEAGGSLESLQRIIRVFYNWDMNDFLSKYYGISSINMPENGIPLEQAIHQMGQAEAHVEKANEAFAKRYNLTRKTTLAATANSVLKSYVQGFEELLPGYDNLSAMKTALMTKTIPAYISLFLSSKEESLEHFLFLMFIRMRYPNDIMELIYTKFGSKYSEIFDTQSELSGAQSLMVDTSIVAELLTEFIMSEMTVSV